MNVKLPCGTVSALAGLLAGVCAPATLADDWRHEAGMSGYFFSMQGTSGAGGHTADVDLSISDVMEHIDGALTGLVRGSNGSWGYWFSYEYMNLGANGSKVLFPEVSKLKLKGSLDIGNTIIDTGLTYNVPGVEWLELLAGVRYTNSDQTLELNLQSNIGNRKLSDSFEESWTNAIAGFRATMPINDRWNASLRLDAGAGDSDSTYQALAMLNYAFTDKWTGAFGYRYLKDDYENNDFVYDIELSGIEMAVTYAF